MRLFTYYDHVAAHDNANELKMLLLWIEHHKKMGDWFEPVVLQEYHAQKHPRYAEFNQAVRLLPSINPAGYDVACYMRWLAVAAVGGSHNVMMDYDTFLTPSVVDDLNPIRGRVDRPEHQLAVWQNTTPCLVTGSAKAFEQAAIWFAGVNPAGRSHLSDMIVLEQVATQEPEAFARFNYAKCYGEQMWNTAPAVHFSNSCMTPADKQPRFKWIPELLKEHTMPTV